VLPLDSFCKAVLIPQVGVRVGKIAASESSSAVSFGARMVGASRQPAKQYLPPGNQFSTKREKRRWTPGRSIALPLWTDYRI